MAVIVGPVTALLLSCVVAAALARRVTTVSNDPRGAPGAAGRRVSIPADRSPAPVPLLVLTAIGLSFTRSIQVIIVAGVISLGFWGGLAGRRAGLRGCGDLGGLGAESERI